MLRGWKSGVEFVVMILFGLISFGIALIPLWILCLAKVFLAPVGFWQNFVLFGAGLWILSGIQFLFLIIWLIVNVKIWLD